MSSDLLSLISDVRPASDYGKIRNDVYKLISKYKAPRYLKLTDRLSMLFEDAVTVWFQIEETIHMEATDDDNMMREIIRTYQPMIPKLDEISFTLFVHVYNDEEMRSLLPKYNGIERGVKMILDGKSVDASPIYPEDYGPGSQVRSMHYLKYKSSGLSELVAKAMHVEVSVDHPQSKVKVNVPSDTLDSIRRSIGASSVKWII